jgi:hypothetical protein
MDALDAATRERLVVVADLLVPAADGMPSASEVDVVGRWLDRVLDADPSLVEPVTALAGCATWEEIEAQAAADPATFELGAFAIVAAYYLHPGVRKRMGYPGQGPSPILDGEADWYLRDDILAPVRARGPVFVPTPDA